MKDNEIGFALMLARKRKGLLQKELGEKAGLSSQWISDLETGKFKPKKQTAIALASVLGESLESLFGDAYTKKDK